MLELVIHGNVIFFAHLNAIDLTFSLIQLVPQHLVELVGLFELFPQLFEVLEELVVVIEVQVVICEG